MKTLNALAIILILGISGCDLDMTVDDAPATQPADPAAKGTADAIDANMPDLLALIGAAGVPLAGALGVYWRKKKLANQTVDIIRSVERAKDELGAMVVKDEKGKRVDLKATLAKALSAQLPETTNLVRRIKARVRPKE